MVERFPRTFKRSARPAISARVTGSSVSER
jgi:hypothetical protein